MKLTQEEQQTYGGAMASVMLDGSPTLEMVEALCKIIGDRLTSEPAPVGDEVAEIERRHQIADDMHWKHNPEFGLQAGLEAHDDRATLLRILRTQASEKPLCGTKEGLIACLEQTNGDCQTRGGEHDVDWQYTADALLSSGAVGRVPTKEEMIRAACGCKYPDCGVCTHTERHVDAILALWGK